MDLMNEVFADFLDTLVILYIDGILDYSQSIHDNVEHLQTVLDLLRGQKLYGNVAKCVFAATEVEYLGFVIGSFGILVDSEKVRAVNVWPSPENKRDVSFLDIGKHYRKFITGCSKNARSLTILKTNDPFFVNK